MTGLLQNSPEGSEDKVPWIKKINLTRSNWQTVISLSLLGLLAITFLWRVAFKGDILLSADMLLLYEPWRSELPGAEAVPIWNEKTADPLRDIYSVAFYIKDTWREGQIPFWYPYVGLGLPILARGMNQVLYPLNNILLQMMDVPEFFGWSAILHLFLVSCFTFFYVRALQVGHFGSLVAAIAFTYSSMLMTWLGLPFIFDSIIWLPLIFLGLEKAITRKDWRWCLLGSLGLVLQILAGSLQLVSYGLIALVIYAMVRSLVLWWPQRSLRRAFYPLMYVGLIIGLGVGGAAIQILPTIELVFSGITRSDVALNLQLPARNLARLLIPDILGTPLDGNSLSSLEFEAYLYLGLFPLFFLIAALFTRQAILPRILFGIGLLFLLVIYNVPPFYQVFYYVYPAFPSLGFHRSIYVISFVWASAAGIGADYILHHRPRPLLNRLVSGGFLVGLIVLIIGLRWAFMAKYQERHFWDVVSSWGLPPNLLYVFSTLFLFLALFGVILWLLWSWEQDKVPKQVFAGAVLVLLVFDLFLTHIDFTPALPKHMLNISPPSLTALQELVTETEPPFRTSGVGNVLRPDTGGAYGVTSVQIHNSYLSQRLSDYADLTGLRSGGTFRDIIFRAAANPLLDALNVKYIYAARRDLADGDWFSVLQKLGQPQVISDHHEAGQIKYWNIKNWSQPVLFSPSNTILDYQVALPFPATLDTALALDPQEEMQSDITFQIYVTKPGQTFEKPIFSNRMEQGAQANQVGWLPIQVDLSQFVQEPVVISLVTASDNGESVSGGWADPLVTDSSSYEQVYYGVNSIYENKNVLPRAWVVHKVTEVSTLTEAKAKMNDPEFDPAVEAVVEGQLSADVQPSIEVEALRFSQYNPSGSQIEVQLTRPGFLVFSDLYYPGWYVSVDGVEKQLYATNLVMRGVYIPSGSHTVEFVYEPLSFKIGFYISLGVTVLGLLSLFLRTAYLKSEPVK